MHNKVKIFMFSENPLNMLKGRKLNTEKREKPFFYQSSNNLLRILFEYKHQTINTTMEIHHLVW